MEHCEFAQKQALPYDAKIEHAVLKAREFYRKTDGRVYCSVGGLDSITLLYFLRKYVNQNIPGVSVSVLEDKSIQEAHRQIENFVLVTPLKSKVQVIREHGYPIISKEKAVKIQALQNPANKNAGIRHSAMTGESGKFGNNKHAGKRKLPEKWLKLFGGLENPKYGTNYAIAPFRVSDKCCYWLKEKPLDQYAKQSQNNPYMGLMAAEGGRRQLSLIKNGCNYYGKTVTRSCPFAIFNKQDLLQLALELQIPVPAIYGEITKDSNGALYTTKAQRTGCSMCGFGIHIEKRPHRFDLLYVNNRHEWYFWMFTMKWGEVLDYINVPWRQSR